MARRSERAPPKVTAVTSGGAGPHPRGPVRFSSGRGRPIQEGMLRLLATVFVLVFALGCPILDELDKGSAEMDKFSPGARALNEKKAKEAAEKQAKSGASKVAGATAGAKEAASKWWSNARSLAPDETEAGRRSAASCNGADQYMSRNDCRCAAAASPRPPGP